MPRDNPARGALLAKPRKSAACCARHFVRPVSDGTPYVIFEITKDLHQHGGRALAG